MRDAKMETRSIFKYTLFFYLPFSYLSVAWGQDLPQSDMEAASVVGTKSAEKNNRKDIKRSVEKIPVVGTHIEGVEEGTLPVEVLDREKIASYGNPTTAQLMQNVLSNTGNEFRTNIFDSAASAGSANVNLKGLGLGATLVLFNNRRHTLSSANPADGSSFVDINFQ